MKMTSFAVQDKTTKLQIHINHVLYEICITAAHMHIYILRIVQSNRLTDFRRLSMVFRRFAALRRVIVRHRRHAPLHLFHLARHRNQAICVRDTVTVVVTAVFIIFSTMVVAMSGFENAEGVDKLCILKKRRTSTNHR